MGKKKWKEEEYGELWREFERITSSKTERLLICINEKLEEISIKLTAIIKKLGIKEGTD